MNPLRSTLTLIITAYLLGAVAGACSGYHLPAWCRVVPFAMVFVGAWGASFYYRPEGT